MNIKLVLKLQKVNQNTIEIITLSKKKKNLNLQNSHLFRKIDFARLVKKNMKILE